MGYQLDDQPQDDFMNASAEEWSKPSKPAVRPGLQSEPTNRWGSPISYSESAANANTHGKPDARNKKLSPWWILLIVLIIVLCCCLSLSVISSIFYGLRLSREVFTPIFYQFL